MEQYGRKRFNENLESFQKAYSELAPYYSYVECYSFVWERKVLFMVCQLIPAQEVDLQRRVNDTRTIGRIRGKNVKLVHDQLGVLEFARRLDLIAKEAVVHVGQETIRTMFDFIPESSRTKNLTSDYLNPEASGPVNYEYSLFLGSITADHKLSSKEVRDALSMIDGKEIGMADWYLRCFYFSFPGIFIRVPFAKIGVYGVSENIARIYVKTDPYLVDRLTLEIRFDFFENGTIMKKLGELDRFEDYPNVHYASFDIEKIENDHNVKGHIKHGLSRAALIFINGSILDSKLLKLMRDDLYIIEKQRFSDGYNAQRLRQVVNFLRWFIVLIPVALLIVYFHSSIQIAPLTITGLAEIVIALATVVNLYILAGQGRERTKRDRRMRAKTVADHNLYEISQECRGVSKKSRKAFHRIDTSLSEKLFQDPTMNKFQRQIVFPKYRKILWFAQGLIESIASYNFKPSTANSRIVDDFADEFDEYLSYVRQDIYGEYNLDT